MRGITLASLQALLYRCPAEVPVVISFGTMHDRPMLLIPAEDRDGTVGWGEAWCNVPAFGAEHRARIGGTWPPAGPASRCGACWATARR